MNVPLACNSGLTHWILVDSSLPPDQRSLLASCESLRKEVLISRNGVVKKGITHGIGSVFSQPSFRGKGYATRMLKELAPILKTWQTEDGKRHAPFSILYSDIGKKYYAKFGWLPFPSTHIHFLPFSTNENPAASSARPLASSDLEPLCAQDCNALQKQLENAKDGKTHVVLLPDLETMQWHHHREDFVTEKLFPSRPPPCIKGAISASPEGRRIWAIWTRAYCGPLGSPKSGNTLHILRLVVEDESPANSEENLKALDAVLQIARREAREWQCESIETWNPSPEVRALVKKLDVKHSEVEREDESIASLMWYGDVEEEKDVIWEGNEKFGWC
jgi:hypothetical protein